MSHCAYLWGGAILDAYYKNEISEKIEKFRRRLDTLEYSKKFDDIKHLVSTFTPEERKFLNSPLLNDLYDSLFPTKNFQHTYYINAGIFYRASKNTKKAVNHLYKELQKLEIMIDKRTVESLFSMWSI